MKAVVVKQTLKEDIFDFSKECIFEHRIWTAEDTRKIMILMNGKYVDGVDHLRRSFCETFKEDADEGGFKKLLSYIKMATLISDTANDSSSDDNQETIFLENNKETHLDEKIREFAIQLFVDYKIRTLTDTKAIMYYRDGAYIKGEEILQNSFDGRFEADATPTNFNKFLHFIRSKSYVSRNEFIEPENKINLNNGVLDIVTRELLPHSPDYNFLYKLDVDYDPDAKCPIIIKFLREITGCEKDYECLVEMIGYTLMSGMKFHVIFMLVGMGNNGKSKFIQLIQTLLDERNCSHVSIQDLANNRFAAADLYGKKAILCSDISSSTIDYTGKLKGLTGQDTIYMEEKGKQGFSYCNSAKPIFSGNELPDIKDKSPAMWNRIILIEFPNEFRRDKEDKDLINKLITNEEMSGLLNIALEGISRLLKNNSFSYDHETTMERWYEFRNKNNPISSFWKECIVEDDDKSVSKKDLFKLYEAYCSGKRIVPVSYKMFGIYVNRYLNQDYDYRPNDGSGNRTHAWKGIRISDSWVTQFHKKQN